MGVEILILSGARQGERLVLDTDEIRAGGTGACDVYFNPADDAAAKGRVALLRRTDEGWSIQNAGNGELLLNQETVSGKTRIRSGDVVRLSDHGPDFTFEIRASRLTPWADTPPQKVSAQPTIQETPADIQQDDVLQSGVESESNLAPIVLSGRSRRRAVLIAAASGSGVLAVLVLLAAGVFSPAGEGEAPVAATNKVTTESYQQPDAKAPPTVVISPKPETVSQQTTASQQTPVSPKPPVSPDSKTASTQTDTASEATKPPVDPWAKIAGQYDKTVWLLRVIDPAGKFVYPFASATAIDRQTLLSTASVGIEMQKFLDQGWEVQARNTALKKTVSIGKIRIHAVFATFADDPQKRIYVDLAVLTTRLPLSVIAPMAKAPELAGLDTGNELACVGISHQSDAIKADDIRSQDELAPKLVGCKLFLRTQFDPESTSSPRLLHLKPSSSGNLPANLYGSPIVDRQGRIVAVYAETAAMGEGKQLRLHYATMIDPAIIERALADREPGEKDTKYWVSPTRPRKKGPARKDD
ncbi:MAG: hypothetical protein JXM70_20665 [Pirellulales bacterium]|nr:hypothetical protein [Pirellulales bacterium]